MSPVHCPCVVRVDSPVSVRVDSVVSARGSINSEKLAQFTVLWPHYIAEVTRDTGGYRMGCTVMLVSKVLYFTLCYVTIQHL